jgi:type I restriction enzyme R subunit
MKVWGIHMGEKVGSSLIDISSIELSHYKLHKQPTIGIKLPDDGTELPGGSGGGGAVPKDPNTELLSEIVEEMNSLFEGELSDDDMLNYARAITDKVRENDSVMQQVVNNTKEQAMMGGFAKAINDAVIDSLDVHQNLATQVLNEDRVRKGLADIVYQLISKGLQSELRV